MLNLNKRFVQENIIHPIVSQIACFISTGKMCRLAYHDPVFITPWLSGSSGITSADQDLLFHHVMRIRYFLL